VGRAGDIRLVASRSAAWNDRRDPDGVALPRCSCFVLVYRCSLCDRSRIINAFIPRPIHTRAVPFTMPPKSRSTAAAAAAGAEKPSTSTTSKSKSRSKAASSSSSSSDSDSSDSSSSDDEEDVKPKKSTQSKSAAADENPDAIRLFNPTSPRHDRMVLHYVSTHVDAATAIGVLSQESVISVDCEGVALSRTGQLCLIQVSTAVHPVTRLFHVFLFDVVALGTAAFTTGLGPLLSKSKPTKLFYDVRRDSESLFHQYGITLAGVCDIQLLEIARRRINNRSVNYLPGLASLLAHRFTDMDVDLQRIKNSMSGKYQEEPDLWLKRPLSKEQTIYAAIDVVLLHVLLEQITSPPRAIKKSDKKKDADQDVEMKDAASVEKVADGTIAAVASSPAAPSGYSNGREDKFHVDPATRSLIEQYSDVVWAASIRSAHHTSTRTHCARILRTHPQSPKAVEV
jgi:hypothetical protein